MADFTHPSLVWGPISPEPRANICITFISLETTFSGLHFRRWQYGSICFRSAVVASQICEIMRNTKKIQNYSSSRSSKVTHFRVNETPITSHLHGNGWPITDYLLEYNNFSLGDEDSENIASERYENRLLRRPLSCLMPHISRTPANICPNLILLETTFTGLHFFR